MKLIFVGSTRFGLRCFDASLAIPNIKIVGVVTAPKTFSISYRPDGVTNVLYADIAARARSNGIPVTIVDGPMSKPSLLSLIAELKPDAFLVSGWYHMIPKNWRAIAPAYGLHASLLPDYSGGAPLVWAIINGETKTGITLFQMDDGVDSGPIVGQKAEPILPDDTIATLYARIEDRGLELIREMLPRLASGTLELRPQDEAKRRIMSQRTPEDGLIDWSKDAHVVDRYIRAQTRPYPGAFSYFNGRPLYIWKAIPFSLSGTERKPGFVEMTLEHDFFISCGSGCIKIVSVSYDGKTFNKEKICDLFCGGEFIGSI